jgi:hypothetical protein
MAPTPLFIVCMEHGDTCREESRGDGALVGLAMLPRVSQPQDTLTLHPMTMVAPPRWLAVAQWKLIAMEVVHTPMVAL